MTATTATDVDTWAAWADTALEAGEPAVAERILRHVLAHGDLEPVRRRWATAMLAGCLVQQGRHAEAGALLEESGLARPTHAGQAGFSHVVGAAAAAADGDGDAFSWLLAIGTAVDGTPFHAGVVALLAAAADGRHPDVADDGWRLLVGRYGARDPYRVARFTATALLRRDRHASPAALREVMAAAADNLMAVVPDALTDPGPANEVAAQLLARDDVAGVVLLRRALARRLHGPGRSADAGAVPTVPGVPHRYRLAAAGAVAALAAATALGPPVVAAIAVVALLLGRAVWAHVVPRPGMTRQESRAWRTVGLDRAGTPVPLGAGFLAAAMVVAIVSAAALAAATLGDPGPDPTWFTERAAVVWLGTPFITGWGAFAAAREAARARLRRSEARRRSAADSLGPDVTCRCSSVIGFTGASAADYLVGHLQGEVPDLDPGVGTVAPDGLVARCPVTGALWLCGPLGRYERPLALRGPLAADATTEDPATEDPAGLDAVDAPDPAESPDLAAAAGTAGPRTGEGFYL